MNKQQKQQIQTRMKKMMFYKQIFLFLKQSNGEWRITINPEYLLSYRKTQGITPEEQRIIEHLDFATWGRVKNLLARMKDGEKKSLLLREWQKHPVSCLYKEGIPEALEKEFLSALKNPKITFLNK
jgi:hypothetical protein